MHFKADALNDITYTKLRISPIDVRAFALEIQKAPPRRGAGYVEFAEPYWSGCRINGCSQTFRGGFVLGYRMDVFDSTIPTYAGAYEALQYIPGVVHAVRLFRLAPGGFTSYHTDIGEFYFWKHWTELRKIHIPIITNAASYQYSIRNGEPQRHQFQAGEFWYLNGSRMHGSENFGNQDRWHLVVDVEPSDQLKELFEL